MFSFSVDCFRYLRLGRLFSLVLLSTLFVNHLQAQQVSGSISGVVRDAQGGAVVNAKVTVINQQQGAVVRETTTTPQGTFFISPLLPADYTIIVEASGFKRYERRDIKLFANDRIGLPEIVLELGTVTETVTVEAEVVQLQTQSAERSGVVTGRQMVDLALNGRNYLDLLKTIPGIVSEFSGQVAGPGGIGAIYANGQRGNQNFLTLDGVSNMDTGSNGTQHTSLNIDNVAEFKVVTNAPQAEFGRSSGAQITIVTKGGTRDFHGTGYWFHRHEGLNANNWRNNVEGRARQLYRFNYQGYNIGGPVFIPGKFNRNRDKLFFFWGNEFQRQLVPNALRSVLVPTQAERNGDFSGTREADGRPVTIFDPLSGLPFPGNIIPQNRIDPDGRRILNFYPLPNVADPPPNFNYQTQVSGSYPRDQYMARLDYNITDHWRVFYRVIRDADSQVMPYGQWSADNNLGIGPMRFGQPGLSMTTNLTTIVNPTLTNEFIVGFSRNRLSIVPTDDTWSRQRLGLQFRMPFPGADPLGLVPNFQWGGVPNAPFSGFNGTPFFNVNNTFDFINNLTKVSGRHSIKMGFFIQRSRKDQTAFTPVNGTINFGRDRANPGDTNWAYSNGLLGNFLSLIQSNIVRNGLYRYTNAEWYIQDTWRVNDRLTLDYGIRFYIIQPQFDANLQTSSFNPQFYTEQDRVALYHPAPGNLARNPLTGETRPAPFIGALVPGVGRFDNGMARAGLDGYPRGLIDSRGVHYGPRFGVAYQFMNKTVFRAGGGIVYDRFQGNPVFDMLPNPPSTLVPQFFYGNIQTVADTPGVLFPVNVRGFDRRGHVPTTYNWNASIQRELPFQLLLDVAYVGSVSRHLLSLFNLNEMPFGSAWLPQNQDPRAATPRLDGTTTLPMNLYRTFPGFGNINITGFGASSNYNSLQVGLNRRMRQGLIFGVAYTWGRALGVAGGDGDLMHPTDFRMANYGPLFFDRPHVLVFNYIYDVPGLGRNGNFLDNKIGRGIFNGWQIAGITSMQSGIPDFIFVDFQGIGAAERNRRLTGSETVAPRPVFVGPTKLSRDSRNHYQWINTDAVRMPVRPSLGLESGSRPIRRPGVHNWDISVYKNFPLFREGQSLQIRLEMFNAPNHPQFSDFNRTAQFNINTGELTNLPTARGGGGGPFGFGAITAARDPRIIQLATKIYF